MEGWRWWFAEGPQTSYSCDRSQIKAKISRSQPLAPKHKIKQDVPFVNSSEQTRVVVPLLHTGNPYRTAGPTALPLESLRDLQRGCPTPSSTSSGPSPHFFQNDLLKSMSDLFPPHPPLPPNPKEVLFSIALLRYNSLLCVAFH